jgi:hypothetical protein
MRCAHIGTFAALARGLSALHLSGCPSEGTVGIASFCTFQRVQKHSNLTFVCFFCMSLLHHPKTHQEHVQTTESTQYSSSIRLTSVHFGKPCYFAIPKSVMMILLRDASPWPRPTATPDVYPCPTLRNLENQDRVLGQKGSVSEVPCKA